MLQHNQPLLRLSLFLLILDIINNDQNKKKKPQPKKRLITQRWKYLFTDIGIMEGWRMWKLNDCMNQPLVQVVDVIQIFLMDYFYMFLNISGIL